MGKKRSLKESERRILQERVNESVRKFCEANPHIDTLEKFEKVLEQVIAVACIPDALYQRYRNSGKTVEEVYKILVTNNN